MAPVGACCQSDIGPTGQQKWVERRGTQKQLGPKARARAPEHKARGPMPLYPSPAPAARPEGAGLCLPLSSEPCRDLLGNHIKLPGRSGMNLCHCRAIFLYTQNPSPPGDPPPVDSRTAMPPSPLPWQSVCQLLLPQGDRRFKSSADRLP